MSKTKVKPVGTKLLMDIPETKAGALDVKQGKQIQEVGTVIDVGEDVTGFKKGDVLHYKAWAVDIVTIDGQTFYYLDSYSDAICGVVTK